MNKLLATLITLSVLLSGSANAGLVTNYNLVLHINSVLTPPPGINFGANCISEGYITPPPPFLQNFFGCLSPGDTFTGHFSVDTAILATDGFNNTAPIYDFYLPLGNLIYAQGPSNTALLGFRSEIGFADAPGFVILNGAVTDLIGGVYGQADYPFIDFSGGYTSNSNLFFAEDGVESAYGTLSVSLADVPEPATYTMVLAGLGLLGFAQRRKQSLVA